jgi:hypothetical protein
LYFVLSVSITVMKLSCLCTFSYAAVHGKVRDILR